MSSPVVALYIDTLKVWSPPEAALEKVLQTDGDTTHLILAFWDVTGPVDVAKAWSTGTFPANAIDRFHEAGVKVLVSGGGGTVEPITRDPNGGAAFGDGLAKFARDNELDGVDFDLEDPAYGGSPKEAVRWTVEATKAAKKAFPDAIVTHAPQAPYFSPSFGDAPYLEIDEQAGDLIDYYNIQFYDQGNSAYSTYETLFVKSDGWAQQSSVGEIEAAGVPIRRMLVGKPVIPTDATNTGYVAPEDLASAIEKARGNGIALPGVMGWQHHSDAATASWTETLAKAFEDTAVDGAGA